MIPLTCGRVGKTPSPPGLASDLEVVIDGIVRSSSVGVHSHTLLEHKIDSFLDVYEVGTEIFVNKPFSSHRIDTNIRVCDNFRKNIIRNQEILNIPDNIREIRVDYTMLTNRYLFDKLFKNYQDHNKFLIIVLYGEQDPNTVANLKSLLGRYKDAPFLQNIAILTISEFGQFLGLNTEQSGELVGLNDLIVQSLTSDDKFQLLYDSARDFEQGSGLL